MNKQTITANIQRYNKAIADITKKEGEQMKKRSTAQKKLNDLSKRMNGRNLSSSTINSILTQMERENKNMVDCDKKLASLANDKSRNQNYLIKEEEKLRKEQDRLNKEQESKRKLQEQKDKAKELQNLHKIEALEKAVSELQHIVPEEYYETPEELEHNDREYDFFISHASEDKDAFVRPFAEALVEAGCKVWYDETMLKPGDSLRRCIDKGLVDSRFGIVVISPSFIKKSWPEYELNGMVAKEMNGHKVIIPIWYNVTIDDVLHFSPTLADKLAIDASRLTLTDVVEQAMSVLQNK